MNRREAVFKKRPGTNNRYATERSFENDYNGWLSEHNFPVYQIRVDEIIRMAKTLANMIRDGGRTSGMLDDTNDFVTDWLGSSTKRN